MSKTTMLTYIKAEQKALSKILATYPEQIDAALVNAPVQTNHWLILGTGSSINAAQSAKLYMQKIANVQIDVEEPYNYEHYGRIDRKIDFVVAISQSGQSTATVSALKKVVNQNQAFATAVTSRPGTEITQAAQTTLDILTGQEKVGYVTMGYNATVLSLMLFSLRSGVKRGLVTPEQEQQELDEFQQIVNQIDNTIEKTTEFYHEFLYDFQAAPQFTSIGYGATVGTTMEMQTKFTEVIREPSNGYELEAFMHGPYLGVHETHRQFFIETHADAEIIAKEQALKNYERRSTTHVFTISLDGSVPDIDDGQTLQLMDVRDPFKAPLLAVVPFQILAWYIAKSHGVNLPHLIFNDFSDVVHNKTTQQAYI